MQRDECPLVHFYLADTADPHLLMSSMFVVAFDGGVEDKEYYVARAMEPILDEVLMCKFWNPVSGNWLSPTLILVANSVFTLIILRTLTQNEPSF
jgi:hypothetical protein